MSLFSTAKATEMRESYDDLKKYLMKAAGNILRDNEDLDTDELIGMYTVLMTKTVKYSDSYMDKEEKQFEIVTKLQDAAETEYKKLDEITRLLIHIDTKLDGIDSRLKELEKAREKKEK